MVAIPIILIGIGIALFPFARNWLDERQADKLLDNLDSGDAIVVQQESVSEGDYDSWADADGLGQFEYEDDFDELMGGDSGAYFAAEIAHADVEIGEEDGVLDPQDEGETGEIGEIALDENVEAEALDVEGLKRKRLIPIGKIEIASIDANLPVVEGAGKTELRYAVGHVANTADFGRTGNCVLAGHRNYTYGSMFNRLGEVAPGDEVLITMRDGTLVRYDVYECIEVRPGAKDITNFHREESRLTIITCTPIGVGTHRLLVRCRLAEIIPPEQAD